MKKLRIPHLRLVATGAVIVVLAAVLVPLVPKIVQLVQVVTSVKHTERNALEVLKSEELSFLVTDRITSQIVVESNDSNPILGKKEGYLIAKAKLYYGIDLAKLTDADLARTNNQLVVHLPEPEELDFSVDLESMRFISKRSGLMVIADWITNADQEEALRTQFRDAALDYMKGEDLIPSKEMIIFRLTKLGEMFSEYIGVKVVFQ
ncbi:MAG TPA: DUF4230 domain-containing protein [bacterium]|nr:DUF4230 domain-containing protein [bacterium]HPQ65559.1 DUF4230 domain-containing protein [bacterium]